VSVTSTAAVAREPLWHLVYRYWFWGWLFRDVNAGDLLRQAAAWRHNVQQRAHLRVYMRRWCGALIVTGALAMAIETLAGARVAAAACYTLAVLCSVFQAFAGIAWAFLRSRDGASADGQPVHAVPERVRVEVAREHGRRTFPDA